MNQFQLCLQAVRSKFDQYYTIRHDKFRIIVITELRGSLTRQKKEKTRKYTAQAHLH